MRSFHKDQPGDTFQLWGYTFTTVTVWKLDEHGKAYPTVGYKAKP